MRSASRTLSIPRSDGAATARARVPTGTIVLPPACAEPNPADKAALDAVNGFVDRLVDLPPFMWLSIGRGLMADREGLLVRQTAWSDVEAAIRENGLDMAAWYARDGVETAACLVSRRVPRWSREERCAFAATHGAAEAATLALLAHQHISPERLRVLCAPFATEADPEGMDRARRADPLPARPTAGLR